MKFFSYSKKNVIIWSKEIFCYISIYIQYEIDLVRHKKWAKFEKLMTKTCPIKIKAKHKFFYSLLIH